MENVSISQNNIIWPSILGVILFYNFLSEADGEEKKFKLENMKSIYSFYDQFQKILQGNIPDPDLFDFVLILISWVRNHISKITILPYEYSKKLSRKWLLKLRVI